MFLFLFSLFLAFPSFYALFGFFFSCWFSLLFLFALFRFSVLSFCLFPPLVLFFASFSYFFFSFLSFPFPSYRLFSLRLIREFSRVSVSWHDPVFGEYFSQVYPCSVFFGLSWFSSLPSLLSCSSRVLRPGGSSFP